jgi:thiol-disulfide isomerase/thioredoxin
MSTVLTAAVAIVASLTAASVWGVLHNRRAGVLRDTHDPQRPAAPDAAGLDLSSTGPTVVHFTAAWCGPCGAVRRVIRQVLTELPQVKHLEMDIDANPAAARQFSVLSLPTTFIFDADGRQRYRSAGVPKAADLRSALDDVLT